LRKRRACKAYRRIGDQEFRRVIRRFALTPRKCSKRLILFVPSLGRGTHCGRSSRSGTWKPNGSTCGAPAGSRRKSPRVHAAGLPGISWNIFRKTSRSSKPDADWAPGSSIWETGYDIAGIDNDAQIISRLKEWRPSLNVTAGDIRRLPFEAGSLGAVISLG